jgi:hypothetical protein
MTEKLENYNVNGGRRPVGQIYVMFESFVGKKKVTFLKGESKCWKYVMIKKFLQMR